MHAWESIQLAAHSLEEELSEEVAIHGLDAKAALSLSIFSVCSIASPARR